MNVGTDDSVSLSCFENKAQFKVIMDIIQTIESSIYFDRLTNPNASIFSTGTSPHFMESPVSGGGRCPFLKFRYQCRENVAVDMGFNQWSLMLHSAEFQRDQAATRLLSAIQRELGYYSSDAFEHHFLRNLQTHQSLFVKPINILFWGNSWLRQIVESMLCLLHSSSRYKEIVRGLELSIQKCNVLLPIEKDVREQTCPGYSDLEAELSLSRDDMSVDFRHSERTKVRWQQEMVDNNVCGCNDDAVHIQLADGSNLFYIFSNLQANKSMESAVKQWRDSGVEAAFLDFDVIVFNLGNGPHYDFGRLVKDVRNLDHSDRPVIFVGDSMSLQDYEFRLAMRPVGGLANARRTLPNLLILSEIERIRKVDSPPMMKGHYCQPGVPAHHALSLLHLTNLLTELREITGTKD